MRGFPFLHGRREENLVLRRYENLYRIGRVRTAKIVEPDDFIVDFASELRERNSRTILDIVAVQVEMRSFWPKKDST